MTNKEKDEAVNDFVKITVTHAVNFFRLMGFETHINATVLDETTGDKYEFTLKKIE
jgi:hypothetical protein